MSSSGKKSAHKPPYLKPPITFTEQVEKLRARNLDVLMLAKLNSTLVKSIITV
ncbi:hypothetical protein [Endozoicomonas acroporae]|uniref:hypothetical protein n=1 Tax=Endozoicomonas acroporae TaxID=1701104 RepID=UPI0019D588C7|nr:hypothetical protein [Endozoicomonas acroporae]